MPSPPAIETLTDADLLTEGKSIGLRGIIEVISSARTKAPFGNLIIVSFFGLLMPNTYLKTVQKTPKKCFPNASYGNILLDRVVFLVTV